MNTTSTTIPHLSVVISGTTMWNPGDDFVRAGVVAALRHTLAPRPINFFFYNFSANVLPPYGQTGTRGNDIAAGDLERLGDLVVIAGLSAGREIKPLYQWIIDAGLTDRVVMVGAGYENDYVDTHCRVDPEATIFRSAKLIIGRTATAPEFIRSLGVPYHHLPCPAPLSVSHAEMREVPRGRRARRVGFSIQLPHQDGIVNQATGAEVARLAFDALESLDGRCERVLIAHHKTEYLEYIHRFRGTDVEVVFQSFWQDLGSIYRGLDVMITTRLHAALYANAHGIPALIINDTDRHTHALGGITHSMRAATAESVRSGIAELLDLDLGVASDEIAQSKHKLLDRYVETMRQPLTDLLDPTDDRAHLSRAFRAAAGAVAVKHRVLSVISRLTPDHWLKGNIAHLRTACERREPWLDTLTVLNWWARAMRPATYLEIGVRRGRSMAQVLNESPGTLAYGFDLWLPDYGSVPSEGIAVENPGPTFVLEELQRIGDLTPASLTVGPSASTVPVFFEEEGSPDSIDLILVDGDHSDGGARDDLRIAFERLAPGGAIVFDDLAHPSHPGLGDVWNEFKADHPDWLFIDDLSRSGTGVAIRPPFDRLRSALEKRTVEHTRAALENLPVDAEAGPLTLLRRLARPGDVAVDVGAHAGRFTEALSRLVGSDGVVFALEPTPDSCAHLRALVREHALDNVVIESSAASDRDGEAELREYGAGRSSWNTLGDQNLTRPDGTPLEPTAKTSVRTIRVDSLLASRGVKRIGVAKIDAEGAEPMVLRGMRETLGRGDVGAVIFEASHRTLVGMGASALEAFDELRGHQYEVSTITDGGGIGDEVRDSCARHAQYVAMRPGCAPAVRAVDRRTPIEIFTIVLNGMPFLPKVYENLLAVKGPWRWHVIEGVSELVHDTAWSVSRGGSVPESLHRGGLSIDGTTAFLDDLSARDGDRVIVYRRPAGQFWGGKRAMVSAPLANIIEPCVLMQMDSDEIWTSEQVDGVRRLFAERPEATAAYFRCNYFVGSDRVVTTRDTYGNHSSYEWLRAWRYKPGCRWAAHEPPRLMTPASNTTGEADLSTIDPILHDETEARGLVFDHYAYTTEAQLWFKESYYGYADAVSQWRGLQDAALPARLADHFGWVSDEALVESCEAAGIEPLLDVAALQRTGGHGRRQSESEAAACFGS